MAYLKTLLLALGLLALQAAAQTCGVCRHVYDADADGDGLAFEDLPDTWRCPVCGSSKSAFNLDAKSGEWMHNEIDALVAKAAEKSPVVIAAEPKCAVCRHTYNPDADGLAFEDLPDSWKCPVCGASKSAYSYSAKT